MKKILTFALLTITAVNSNAQLSDWQKSHVNKIMFFNNWLQSRLNEGDADASAEIELGDDFWFRAYVDDDTKAKAKDKVLDLRLSCDGVSVTLHELSEYTNTKFHEAKGFLPLYSQIQNPGVSDCWKNRNIFSDCGLAKGTEFEQKGAGGCLSDAFYAESLLRFLLSKIDGKVVPGAVLNVKYELVYQTKGKYRTGPAEFETMAEGSVNFKVPAKEKIIVSQLYDFLPKPGMSDPALEATIKKGILALTTGYVKDIQKIQIVSNGYSIEKNYQGTPLDQWLQVKIVYTSPITTETFTSLVNVVFLYNGSGYEPDVHNAYFQCGNTFVPTYAIGK